MSKKRTIKTTVKQIVDWGQRNIDECGYGVDAAEMETHCWRCGHDDRPLERCHVIPHSLGGEDTPSNYRLLCNACHHEATNVNDPNAMDEWIRETCIASYNRFWPMREIIKEAAKDASIHFGHGGWNLSTSEWVMKRIMKLYYKRFPSKYSDLTSVTAFAADLFPKKYLVK